MASTHAVSAHQCGLPGAVTLELPLTLAVAALKPDAVAGTDAVAAILLLTLCGVGLISNSLPMMARVLMFVAGVIPLTEDVASVRSQLASVAASGEA